MSRADQPTHQDPRPSRWLVVLPLVLACATPDTASAVLLWKKKRAQQQANAEAAPATAPASVPADDSPGVLSAPIYKPRDPAPRRRHDGWVPAPAGQRHHHHAHAGSVQVGHGSSAWATARSLGATGRGAPAPELITTYGHQLNRLHPLHDAVVAGSGDGAAQADAHLAYGNALAEFGYDPEAAAEFASALELDPTLSAAWNNLGSLVRRSGSLGAARTFFEGLLARDRRDGLAWFNLAVTLEALAKEPKADVSNLLTAADDAYLQALQLAPSLWMPALNPLIIGNDRARMALHRNYLSRRGGGSLVLAR
ncbi:MAG: hypothetical protein AAF533_07860 [Acidobacteriota bacterium]